MTPTPGRRWSPGWSTTPERSSPRSTGVELDDEQPTPVGLLALVAGQDVEPGDSDGTWRIARRVAKDRVISTVDPETRHMHKSRAKYRDGYKAHVAIEPETGFITACALTPANTADGADRRRAARRRAARLAGPRRLRLRVRRGARRARRRRTRRGDQAEPASVATRISATTSSTATTSSSTTPPAPSPAPTDTPSPSPTAATPRSGPAARLPAAMHAAPSTRPAGPAHRRPRPTPRRRPRRAGATATTPIDYRQRRPMVERIDRLARRHGHRRVRYRGVERNQLGLSIRAAAINLRRLVNLGLNHGPTRLGNSPPEQAGPGLTKRERHLGDLPSSATGSHPETPALRSVMSPDPPPRYAPPPDTRKRLVQRLPR